MADIFKTRTSSIMDLDYIEMKEEKAKPDQRCLIATEKVWSVG
jgi:hypothetical protein